MNLWRVLGYDEIAEEILKQFNQENMEAALLEGPPGVGKSWLAKGIGSSWQEMGGRTIIAEGDKARSDFAFYPFDTAMGVLSSQWKHTHRSVVATGKAAETFLGTAGLVTTAFEGVTRLRNYYKKRKTVFLGEHEQEIFSDLERLGGKKNILLIADNLHWWDKRSLLFLRELFKPAMVDSFPFLENIRLLAVQTIPHYQPIIHQDTYNELLRSVPVVRYSLQRIKRKGFEHVLTALGAPTTTTPEIVDTVHKLSGGHLALAQRSANRLVAGDHETFLSISDSDKFIEALISDRFLALGNIGEKVIEVLQTAAVLGLVFQTNEITCASQLEPQEMSMLLRHCSEENVIEYSNDTCSFIHDLYRHFFIKSSAADLIELHKRLSYCFRILRPAEYDLRCMNELKTKQYGKAVTLGTLAALQNIREGKQWDELPPPVLSIIADQNATSILNIFIEAFDLLGEYRHRECLSVLDRLPRDLAKPLLAEADYIRAMCRMSTRTEYDRGIGRSLLSAWDGYEAEEAEIGTRLARLLLYGMSHLMDKEGGRELEGKIRQILIERVAYDSSAKDDLYTMDRCSGSLYQPDIALVRNREAAAHFGPPKGQTIIRRPVEYYRCLVNLGACYIANAKYGKAMETHAKVKELIELYPSVHFPRIDYFRNNALLAEFRLNQLPITEVVSRQRDILDNLGLNGDPFYINNALAVYLCFDNAYANAITIWNELADQLHQRNEHIEPSMEYLIRANRYAAYYLAGKQDLLPNEWDELRDVVKSIAYVFRPALVRRHELLREVFQNPAVSPSQYDSCLISGNQNEYGPMWDSLGRGFRLPEVEFWREN